MENNLNKERGAGEDYPVIDMSPNEHAMALIEGIRVDLDNFSYISQTGKISGSLLTDLKYTLISILRELYAEKRTRLDQGNLLNRFMDKLDAAHKRIEELEAEVKRLTF